MPAASGHALCVKKGREVYEHTVAIVVPVEI